jgi:thioredoxin reductase (NADPH)
MQKKRLVIIGSGPAGLSAALYAGRAQLNPVVIAGDTLGGQVSQTHEIENYPGFPETLSGAELVDKFRSHAERFGAEVVYDMVTEVDFSKGSPFIVKTHNETYSADAVIITVGASARKLNVPGEFEYTGKGVSYCGTCDGFFFRGKDVVVVGGGDSAIEESLFLTRFVNSLKVIHRRDTLRAGTALTTRAAKNDKISYVWDSVVDEIVGGDDGIVKSVKVRNVKTGEVSEEPTDGVFIFIGHIPNSKLFDGQLETNEAGYLITDERYQTNVPGVYAAGEIQDEIWRQVSTSVGQGAAAGMSAIHFLEEHEDELQSLEESPEMA